MKEARFGSIQPIDKTLIRCYYSGPEWTWEWWQWRGIPHSRKLQHCWNLTIRLFSVMSRTLIVVVGGWWVLPLCREADWAIGESKKVVKLSTHACGLSDIFPLSTPFIGTHFNRPCLSVHRSGRVCPGSSASQLRCALTIILEPQGIILPGSNALWRS